MTISSAYNSLETDWLIDSGVYEVYQYTTLEPWKLSFQALLGALILPKVKVGGVNVAQW